jgi:hypothetical protein
VRCKGRGEAPSALAVNQVAWEVHKQRMVDPHGYILVHCTHGHNRTGEWAGRGVPIWCVCRAGWGGGVLERGVKGFST